MQLGVHLSLADDAPEQLEVAVELPVDRQQVAQLAVIDAHVHVDQVLRHGFVGNGVFQVVEDHVGVVEVALGARGEAIAVVPLAHDLQGGVHVLPQHPVLPVPLQEALHLFLGEAEHLVELRRQADVGADIEA